MMCWYFTSNGEPAYYADSAGELAGQEMPGYRPGTVTGKIREEDLWQILIVAHMWLDKMHEADDWCTTDTFDDYLWACKAKTLFLYDSPTHDRFNPITTRVVSGYFNVTDELGTMGFSACFTDDRLKILSLEADTDWFVIFTDTTDERYSSDNGLKIWEIS